MASFEKPDDTVRTKPFQAEADDWQLSDADCFAGAVALARRAAGAEPIASFELPELRLTLSSNAPAMAGRISEALSYRRLSQVLGSDASDAFEWQVIDVQRLQVRPQLPVVQSPLGRYGIFQQSADGQVMVERREGFTTVFEPASARFTTLVEDAGLIDNDVLAKPLLRFLFRLSFERGYAMLHAAVLGFGGEAMLVTGLSGAGKSTFSASALMAGAEFVSDDFMMVKKGVDGYVAHSIYASALVGEQSLELEQGLRGKARPPTGGADWQKHLIPVATAFPGATVHSLRLTRLALLSRGPDGPPQITQCDPQTILRELAPTSILSSPWREPERGRDIFALVAALPCYRLTVSKDLKANGQFFRSVMEGGIV